LLTKGAEVSFTSADGMRCLLIAGQPLHEPVAWGGPIVMNTREELSQAFDELDRGTFIKG
jgi:redox-sensitive bicupin YhaK (pirin superfamily)